MWPYWLLFALPAYRALMGLWELAPAQPGSSTSRWPEWWRVAFVGLVLLIGLRHQVGGDWSTYLAHIEATRYQTLLAALRHGDPAYSLFNWLAGRTGMGVYLVNTLCAAIFSWGLIEFCRAQPRPWLALVVAVPYLITVVAMGYTRQGTAIGLVMWALVALSARKLMRFVVLVALAATFHKSAVILMPLAALAGARRPVITALWVGVVFVLAYVLMLQEALAGLQAGYITAQYQSQGAAVRVAMNAVPAVVFLGLRQRFLLPHADRVFWTWMSLGALGFVVWLVLSPSSTAVDRVALYWIPLQLFVLSRLPNAIGSADGVNKVWLRGVVAYCFVVLFVWLVFASHSFAWLPYQFYPWVWLWR